jgi:hypothetical protein
MFDTLEDEFEKTKPPLDRGWPILMYGADVCLSSTVLILGICGVRGHGFSHLFSLIVWTAMFLLSLTWLITSLRSSTPIARSDFRVRYTILWVLLMLAMVLEDILR